MAVQAVAANGVGLDEMRGISDLFVQKSRQPEPTGAKEVEVDAHKYCVELNAAMAKHATGDTENSLKHFEEALKIRSQLMSSPHASDDIKVLVKNTIQRSKSGNPAECLELTYALHANVSDPHYKGEEPVVAKKGSVPAAENHFLLG